MITSVFGFDLIGNFIYPIIKILFILCCLFLGISLIVFIISGFYPHKLDKVMKISKKGELTLKDPELQEQMNNIRRKELIKKIEGPKPSETIYCPKCHSAQRIGTDFCLNCGKNLTLLNT